MTLGEIWERALEQEQSDCDAKIPNTLLRK